VETEARDVSLFGEKLTSRAEAQMVVTEEQGEMCG
jgi:hypothetical protein